MALNWKREPWRKLYIREEGEFAESHPLFAINLPLSDKAAIRAVGYHTEYGGFITAHAIGVDSKGNIYTTETYEGKRLQKFNYKGIGAVPATTN